jgi:proline dehydrogenase
MFQHIPLHRLIKKMTMDSNPIISFENTENAFAYKTNKELKLAHFLFSSMSYQFLVKMGTTVTPWVIKAGIPIKGLIRNTIFKQFVGGETLQETAKVAKKLAEYNVKTILDYGVEGKEGESNYDHACEEFIKVIDYASTKREIPFMSVKVTGFCRHSLLEKLNKTTDVHAAADGYINTESLTEKEKEEWNRFISRVDKVCAAGCKKAVRVLIDAEESWIQNPVDAITMAMMEKYNKENAIVFNTIQLYRVNRVQFLMDSFEKAKEKGFFLGEKLVRGAYMEKERKRADELNYPSPIQPDKESTDKDFNTALEYCMSHLEKISVVVATHNEKSNLLAVDFLRKNGHSINHHHVHFSQLYGMSDNITFNLAKAGCIVSKYLPFGPIEDVIPYLMRRAQENSSVAGQTGRELGLIKKELKRRN